MKSHHLDWRVNYDIQVEPYDLGPEFNERAVRLVRGLGLRMGVMDLKMIAKKIWSGSNLIPKGNFSGLRLWLISS